MVLRKQNKRDAVYEITYVMNDKAELFIITTYVVYIYIYIYILATGNLRHDLNYLQVGEHRLKCCFRQIKYHD